MEQEPKVSVPAKGTSFRKVTKSYNRAAAQREPAKYTLSPSGLIRSNTEGKELTRELVRDEKGDPDNFQLTSGGNEELGQLALYLGEAGDTGLMRVTLYKNSLSFHAGAAFEEYPKLRPHTKVDCFISKSTDAEGAACLIVQIAGASPTHKVKRKGSGTKAEKKDDPKKDEVKKDPSADEAEAGE